MATYPIIMRHHLGSSTQHLFECDSRSHAPRQPIPASEHVGKSAARRLDLQRCVRSTCCAHRCEGNQSDFKKEQQPGRMWRTWQKAASGQFIPQWHWWPDTCMTTSDKIVIQNDVDNKVAHRRHVLGSKSSDVTVSPCRENKSTPPHMFKLMFYEALHHVIKNDLTRNNTCFCFLCHKK